MEKRFEYVVATDMKALVAELNDLSNQYYFSVVYIADGIAIIDTLVNPTVILEDDSFEPVVNRPEITPSFA